MPPRDHVEIFNIVAIAITIYITIKILCFVAFLTVTAFTQLNIDFLDLIFTPEYFNDVLLYITKGMIISVISFVILLGYFDVHPEIWRVILINVARGGCWGVLFFSIRHFCENEGVCFPELGFTVKDY